MVLFAEALRSFDKIFFSLRYFTFKKQNIENEGMLHFQYLLVGGNSLPILYLFDTFHSIWLKLINMEGDTWLSKVLPPLWHKRLNFTLKLFYPWNSVGYNSCAHALLFYQVVTVITVIWFVAISQFFFVCVF